MPYGLGLMFWLTRNMFCGSNFALMAASRLALPIMEAILLDSMFDLPSLEGVKEVVISQQVVDGTARPLYMYSGGVRAS